MGISFRLLSVEDIGDLRELLENDGMLYHPQYLAHFCVIRSLRFRRVRRK